MPSVCGREAGDSETREGSTLPENVSGSDMTSRSGRGSDLYPTRTIGPRATKKPMAPLYRNPLPVTTSKLDDLDVRRSDDCEVARAMPDEERWITEMKQGNHITGDNCNVREVFFPQPSVHPSKNFKKTHVHRHYTP